MEHGEFTLVSAQQSFCRPFSSKFWENRNSARPGNGNDWQWYHAVSVSLMFNHHLVWGGNMMPHGILVLFTKNVHAPCFSDIHFVRHIGCNSEQAKQFWYT